MTDSRNSRKVRTGVVTSVSGAKTIVVTITERKRHPKYGKMMTSSKKLHAHDEECTAGVGDTVRVMETRPMSKMKRWRLIEVVERADVFVLRGRALDPPRDVQGRDAVDALDPVLVGQEPRQVVNHLERVALEHVGCLDEQQNGAASGPEPLLEAVLDRLVLGPLV